ncbi:hypothetical protein ACNAW0_22690 [Micromonospora sp. SL1-18]|uniref:hypothetical protein n=1 Tax=Micromonospora sp. SL1-18 TaxID=3399128 RepID=UPI003A4DD1E9
MADPEAEGEGEADGDGEGARGGRGEAFGVVRTGLRVNTGTAGQDRRREPRPRLSEGAGADHGRPVATGVRLGRAGGWAPSGSGSTTGPIEGVGMNGVLASGRALLPMVADPVLIAARMGMDAVPASSATVTR